MNLHAPCAERRCGVEDGRLPGCVLLVWVPFAGCLCVGVLAGLARYVCQVHVDFGLASLGVS